MRFSVALLVSLAVHGALALAVIVYLRKLPKPVTTVTLDLSSVQLSFAPQEAEAEPPISQPIDWQNDEIDREEEPEKEPEPVMVEKRPEPKPEKKPEPKPQRKVEAPRPVPPAAAPRQARVDAPPRPRRTIRPDYPRGSRLRGEQGTVVVELEVAADGSVAAAKVAGTSGFPELDAAALKAVRAARFTPAESEGKKVSATARLALQFRLK